MQLDRGLGGYRRIHRLCLPVQALRVSRSARRRVRRWGAGWAV